ncbi:hypothetical protein HYU10_02820 [Candidatus Woesearchaeota archaeon]|nr:hypothetical protein [Candidatus Woesearchaeota archaeon]
MPEDTSQITWIILNAVRNLQNGVDKLALFVNYPEFRFGLNPQGFSRSRRS